MYTSGLLLLVTVLLISYLGLVTAQVSFSTHWGGGKRSSIFKTQSEASKSPSIFGEGKQASFFDSSNDIPQLFRENNEILQCLARMEFNVIKYMTLILEKELKQARKCIFAEKDMEYD